MPPINHHYAERFVSCAKLPSTAQRAAIQVGLADALARNPVLDEDIWFELWSLKNDAYQATRLVSRPLSPAQLDAVVRKERRTSVLDAAFRHTRPSDDQALAVLSRKATAGVAKTICEKFADDPQWGSSAVYLAAARLRRGMSLLKVCAVLEPELLDEAEVRELLADFSSWAPGPSRPRSLALSRLLEARPCLIDAFVAPDASPALLVAAAGNRHLIDEQHQLAIAAWQPDLNGDTRSLHFALLALISNPHVTKAAVQRALETAESLQHVDAVMAARRRLEAFDAGQEPATEPQETVSRRDHLEWYIRRAIPRMGFDGRVYNGRPYELAALSLNPNLTDDDRTCLCEGLGVDRERAFTFEEFEEILTRLDLSHQPGSTTVERQMYVPPPVDTSDFAASTVAKLLGSHQSVHKSEAAQSWVVHELGDDEATWALFFTMMDDDPAETTLDELSTIVRSIA